MQNGHSVPRIEVDFLQAKDKEKKIMFAKKKRCIKIINSKYINRYYLIN